MIRRFSATLLLVTILLGMFPIDNVALALPSRARSAQILDNFKESQQEILFENVPFTSDEERKLFSQNKTIFSLSEALERVNNAKEEVKAQKLEVSARKITLQNFIADLDADIAKNEADIETVKNEVTRLNRDIADYSKTITDTKAQVDANKKTILNYLAYLYSHGELVYQGGSSNVDLIKTLVLHDGDLSEVFSWMYSEALVELAGQSFINQSRALMQEYYTQKETLKHEKLAHLQMKAELASKQDDIVRKREYKAQILEATKGQESLFNRYLSDKQDLQQKLEDRVHKAVSESDNVFAALNERFKCDGLKSIVAGDTATQNRVNVNSNCGRVQAYYTAEKTLRDNLTPEDNDSKLMWPVEPGYGISTYFHDPSYFAVLGSEHEAIDIPTYQGTPIAAPLSGYAYFINAPTPGGYGYMAIKHANGMVTVYGHISQVLVEPFQFIKRGEVFAKSGGAIGTPGAGPMTSGPHLHFEVYQDRVNIDPLRHMDLTHLRFESLDAKYRYKYLEDLKARYNGKINMTQFQKFLIAGDSEVERQKYLLKNYAAADFTNWNIWVQESLAARVDPSFTMCVGLAESGLGRHLKTAYNVGNVGNTDSGSTYSFDGPEQGIRWMLKTFNNKFLGRYQTVDQLSRYGNKTGAIYASSDRNWHNNVIKCLSSLKGRFIEDEYHFRLSDDEVSSDAQ